MNRKLIQGEWDGVKVMCTPDQCTSGLILTIILATELGATTTTIIDSRNSRTLLKSLTYLHQASIYVNHGLSLDVLPDFQQVYTRLRLRAWEPLLSLLWVVAIPSFRCLSHSLLVLFALLAQCCYLTGWDCGAQCIQHLSLMFKARKMLEMKFTLDAQWNIPTVAFHQWNNAMSRASPFVSTYSALLPAKRSTYKPSLYLRNSFVKF